MADDAITVRLGQGAEGCVGWLDFPAFQAPGGKIVRADSLPSLPAGDALLKARQIQPFTPFSEVVVRLEDGVEWLPAWGELV